MAKLGNRSGAVLPTPMEAWEHNLNGRRLLPSPGPKNPTTAESDKARSVRLLLAKHGEQVNQVLNLSSSRIGNPQSQITRGSTQNLERPSSTEDNSEEYHNLCPGDSFPMTGNNLVAISLSEIDGNEEASEDEQELLKRLGQGQARMEQIKRMLVNQRGFIVQALKQLTESNSSNREVRSKFAQQIREQKEAIEQLALEPRECNKCTSTRQLDKVSLYNDFHQQT